MRFTLRGARLVDAAGVLENGAITVEGEHIVAVGSEVETPGIQIDVTGMLVTPGFVDVHTHGGGGYQLHTSDGEEIHAYANWVACTGVTSFLVGVVGVPHALPQVQLAAAVEAIQHHKRGAEPLGIHLEGPYIHPQRRGAHPLSWLRLPNADETELIVQCTQGHLRLVTLAPELPGAAAMIRRLVDAGVTVSIGHTDATYEQALEAFQLGITHMTHCCNAMRGLHHRAPGPIAAMMQSPQVSGELIGDGIHVHPAVMKMLVRALGVERILVITDAQAAAGQEQAAFAFAGQDATIMDGAVRLVDGTLAGSVLTMDQALRNMISMTDCSVQAAVGMLTNNPARSIGFGQRKGRLHAGYDADLLLLDQDLHVQVTICRGRVVYSRDEWQGRSAFLPT